MYKIAFALFVIVLVAACQSSTGSVAGNNRIELREDTINVVKTTDTLQISKSACRGCAEEYIPRFDIEDSLNIIELLRTETVDNNPPDMDGGSLSKYIVMIPRKAGTTAVKLYQFMGHENTVKDSANYILYPITVIK